MRRASVPRRRLITHAKLDQRIDPICTLTDVCSTNETEACMWRMERGGIKGKSGCGHEGCVKAKETTQEVRHGP